MTAIEYVDRPPPGWFVMDVMRESARKWDWVAVMIDVDPEDFRERRAEGRFCYVRLPGKYRNRDVAWDTLEAMMATRH